MKNSEGSVVRRLLSRYSLLNLSLCGNNFAGNSFKLFPCKPTSFKFLKLEKISSGMALSWFS